MYEEVTLHPGNATLLVRFVNDQTEPATAGRRSEW